MADVRKNLNGGHTNNNNLEPWSGV